MPETANVENTNTSETKNNNIKQFSQRVKIFQKAPVSIEYEVTNSKENIALFKKLKMQYKYESGFIIEPLGRLTKTQEQKCYEMFSEKYKNGFAPGAHDYIAGGVHMHIHCHNKEGLVVSSYAGLTRANQIWTNTIMSIVPLHGKWRMVNENKLFVAIRTKIQNILGWTNSLSMSSSEGTMSCVPAGRANPIGRRGGYEDKGLNGYEVRANNHIDYRYGDFYKTAIMLGIVYSLIGRLYPNVYSFDEAKKNDILTIINGIENIKRKMSVEELDKILHLYSLEGKILESSKKIQYKAVEKETKKHFNISNKLRNELKIINNGINKMFSRPIPHRHLDVKETCEDVNIPEVISMEEIIAETDKRYCLTFEEYRPLLNHMLEILNPVEEIFIGTKTIRKLIEEGLTVKKNYSTKIAGAMLKALIKNKKTNLYHKLKKVCVE